MTAKTFSGFVDIANPIWNQLIEEASYDIYHLNEYLLLDAHRVDGHPVIWLVQSDAFNLAIPFIKQRYFAQGLGNDLCSPYGYPGCLFSGDFSGQLDWVLDCFVKDSLQHGFPYSFIRLHPLLQSTSVVSRAGLIMKEHGHTIAISLIDANDTICEQYSENHRRNIRRSSGLGYSVLINDWEFYDQFIEHYYHTMARRKAAAKYFFSLDYFHTLKQVLNHYLDFIVVVSPEGEFAGGGLFSRYKSISQYLYGATNEKYLFFSPTKLMIHAAINQFQSQNCKWLHLGGGYGANDFDGLFRFKKGFSPIQIKYRTIEVFHEHYAKSFNNSL